MKFGFIPTEGGQYYAEFLEEVRLGEELGFDSVWLEEHHGVKNHYWPSPLVALAGAATQTERILLGTDIIVMPFYHPVRVAEDAAMLDVMSAGRFILGAAIGYKPDEFALYQTPLAMRGARFEEAVQLIKQLWTQEEVHFSGKYYHVEGLKIEPRPLDNAHPPLWLGGWGELSLARAARQGDAWVPGPTASLEKLLSAQDTYRHNLVALGIDPQTVPSPLTREVVIAASDEEAREMARKHLLINYRDEYGGGKWKHPLIGAEDTAPVDEFDAIARQRFLVGAPQTVVEKLQLFVDAFGVDHLICRLYFPGMPHDFIMEELRLLAREVMPAFKD
ncbi:MAG TPA: LLM class flavin-dependent oxidoreductase [Candidatus Binatia bacterium]|jgi:probable F420-dependent oxidoreductase|nr:LLM class flavin-dependent oxidoreductase [Candidatus Binatia bacterium]